MQLPPMQTGGQHNPIQPETSQPSTPFNFNSLVQNSGPSLSRTLAANPHLSRETPEQT